MGTARSREGVAAMFEAAIVAPLVLMLAGAFSAAALRFRRRARFVEANPVGPIARLAEGPAAVSGQVVEAGPTLVAPLSGRPCVYYRLHVQERRGGRLATVVDDSGTVPFAVDDGTGRAHVELGRTSPRLDPRPDASPTKVPSSPPEDRLARRYGLTTRGWSAGSSLRFRETIVAPGDRLYVLGRATIETGRRVRIDAGSRPSLVTDRDASRLIRRDRRAELACWVLAGLIVLTGVAAVLIGPGG